VKRQLDHRGKLGNERLTDWEAWALAEADKLNPILSGHIMSRLEPPQLLRDEY